MRRERERVGTLFRDLREAVVEVLGRLAHRRCRLVDQALRDETRVEVDVLAHRVVAHVLDAAGDGDVHRAERDLAGRGSHRRERACAHPVDREAGHRLGNAREQCDVAAERQALVADLRRRGEHDVADAVGRDSGVPAEQLADSLDGHVVCACAPVLALRACLSEWRADAVDEEDLSQLTRHEGHDSLRLTDQSICAAADSAGRARPGILRR